MAAVSGFYDGRGSLQSRLVVLSALVGGHDEWGTFQGTWKQKVNSHLDGRALSVTDCLHPGGGKKLKGIPESRRVEALREAVEFLNGQVGKSLQAFTVVVKIDDYKRAKSEGIQLVAPEAMCVDHVLPCIVYGNRSAEGFEYFFDEGEKFIRQVRPFWREKPSRRSVGPYYLRKVNILTTASSEIYVAVQAADVYVWAAHTFCSQFWLGETGKHVPEPLLGVIQEPPNNWLCDYDFMRNDPRATNRTLASMTPVPPWVVS